MKPKKLSLKKLDDRITEVRLPDGTCGLAERIVTEKSLTVAGKTTKTKEVTWKLSPNIRHASTSVLKGLQAA